MQAKFVPIVAASKKATPRCDFAPAVGRPLQPAGLFCESWIGGIEGEGRDVANALGVGSSSEVPAPQGGSDKTSEVVRGNAHAGARVFERLLQLLLILQDALVTGLFRRRPSRRARGRAARRRSPARSP